MNVLSWLLLLICGIIIQTTVYVSTNFHALSTFVFIPIQWTPDMIAFIFTKRGSCSFLFILSIIRNVTV
jgi:hypothetical protein